MKPLAYTLILAIIIISCATTQDKAISHKTQAQKGDTIKIANDSLEYEIIIIEPGFNSWLATQPPRGFISQPTLEIRNIFFVNRYNYRVLDPRFNRSGLYQQRIDYESNIDYGYEVNYLLYNYFVFFQQEYNQSLR